MSDLERLNIILAARDREFARAMEQNQRRVERFAARSQRHLSKTTRQFDVMSRAAKLAAPLLAGLGAGAVINNLKSTIASLDDIGKTADKIGITTDALQELRTVAESSGIAQASLDSSLERFNKRLGEAQQGMGAAKKTLDQMGISANYLAGLGLDQALSVVADEMAKITDPTERAAVAAALFGREGVAMVNLLREGSDGMAQMRQEARELGIVLDEDMVRAAEDAQTKLDLMARVVSADLSSALINLAPLLVSTAQGIASITGMVRDFLSVNWTLPELVDADGLREMAQGIAGVEKEYLALQAAENSYQANVEKYGENSKEAAAWARDRAAAETDLRDALAAKRVQDEANNRIIARAGQLGDEIKAAKDVARAREIGAAAAERERIAREKIVHRDKMISDYETATGGQMSDAQMENVLALADAWEVAQIAASKVLNPVKGAGAATKKAKDEAQEYADMLAVVEAATGATGLASASYAEVMAQLNELQAAGVINGDQYADMLDMVEGKFQGAARNADTLRDSANRALTDIVTNSGRASDALSNLLSNWGGMFANAAFGGLLKDVGIFDAIGDLLSYDGGGDTPSGPRSGGLDGKGGFLAIMHPRESVIDHTKGQRAAAGGGNAQVSININVSGARGNSEIQDMVHQGVRQGLQEYDRTVLPRSVAQINKDPRRIG